jgi:hypothetical protein
MDITIVDNESDRKEVNRVLDGYAELSMGDISREMWSNRHVYPRKQWLMYEDNKHSYQAGLPFTVIDNRVGECFVEGFATLDGAMLYLCDCHTTCEHQIDWDHDGSVREHGGFDAKEHCVEESPRHDHRRKWVIKIPIGMSMLGSFMFGYVKSVIPHGRSDEVFDEDVKNAILFDSEDDADAAAQKLGLPMYDRRKNIVCVDDEKGFKDVSE